MEIMRITPELISKLTASMEQRLQERYPEALTPALDALQKDARIKTFLFGDSNAKMEIKEGHPSRMKWVYLKSTFEMSADPTPFGGLEGRDEMFSILIDRFSDAADNGKTVKDAIAAVHEYADKIKRGDFGNKLS